MTPTNWGAMGSPTLQVRRTAALKKCVCVSEICLRKNSSGLCAKSLCVSLAHRTTERRSLLIKYDDGEYVFSELLP